MTENQNGSHSRLGFPIATRRRWCQEASDQRRRRQGRTNELWYPQKQLSTTRFLASHGLDAPRSTRMVASWITTTLFRRRLTFPTPLAQFVVFGPPSRYCTSSVLLGCYF